MAQPKSAVYLLLMPILASFSKSFAKFANLREEFTSLLRAIFPPKTALALSFDRPKPNARTA
ncbi:hypothetical protein [Antrihabitans stalactiti]|uniref:Uncharacterized protein n=1 Tax=Antrihabitans stalactiti TaxID=2584121 RepID=A0A848KJM5_9NOCA|nr:hypothetical protein [Antrihabitans stalactiti]NMN98026.1 hypothetical protein [Antrihabitans stalactiti]